MFDAVRHVLPISWSSDSTVLVFIPGSIYFRVLSIKLDHITTAKPRKRKKRVIEDSPDELNYEYTLCVRYFFSGGHTA